jgi:hypothetical protein
MSDPTFAHQIGDVTDGVTIEIVWKTSLIRWTRSTKLHRQNWLSQGGSIPSMSGHIRAVDASRPRRSYSAFAEGDNAPETVLFEKSGDCKVLIKDKAGCKGWDQVIYPNPFDAAEGACKALRWATRNWK